MDVGKRAEQLVGIELDLKNGHDGLHLVKVARRTVDCLWDIFKYQIEVHLVFLWLIQLAYAI